MIYWLRFIALSYMARVQGSSSPVCRLSFCGSCVAVILKALPLRFQIPAGPSMVDRFQRSFRTKTDPEERPGHPLLRKIGHENRMNSSRALSDRAPGGERMAQKDRARFSSAAHRVFKSQSPLGSTNSNKSHGDQNYGFLMRGLSFGVLFFYLGPQQMMTWSFF